MITYLEGMGFRPETLELLTPENLRKLAEEKGWRGEVD